MKSLLSYVLLLALFLGLCIACDKQKKSLPSKPFHHSDTISNWIDSSKVLPPEQAITLLEESINASKKHNNTSLELRAISRLGVVTYKSGMFDHYKRHSQNLITKAMRYKDTSYLAKGYSFMGSYYSRLGTVDSAYYYFNEAKTHYLKIKDSSKIASTMLNMAIIETGIGDYYGSENTTISALSYLSDKTELKTTRALYNNLGVLSYESGQYDDALYWYKLAFDITKDIKGKAVILNNIGLIYRDTNDYDTAVDYFQNALALNVESEPVKAMVMDNLGYVYLLQQKSQGFDLMDKALAIRNHIENSTGQVVSQLHFGHYHFKNNDTTKAKAMVLPALELAKSIKDSKNQLKLYKLLYEYLPHQGYTKAYIHLKDSISKVERNYKHLFAKIRYRTKQKEQDYDVLEDQYQAQTQTLEVEVLKTKWLTILFTITLFFIAIGIYTYRQRKKIHRQQLVIEQLKARAEEKENLSARLHDTIASDILLGLQHSEHLKQQFGGKEFNTLIGIFERAYDKARHISQDLSQRYFNKTPFKQKLRNLCIEYGFRNDLDISLQGIDTIDWHQVHDTIKVAVYDITKEGLTNILKHAKASKAELNFSTKGKSISIEICDNGKGIATKPSQKGIGLLSIECRVSSVSGTLTITDNQPKGTILRITIPILTDDC